MRFVSIMQSSVGQAARTLSTVARPLPLSSCRRLQSQHLVLQARCAAVKASKPTASALGASARQLRETLTSHAAVAEIARQADATVDSAAALATLRKELQDGEEDFEVLLQGEPLAEGAGRRRISLTTPLGLEGKAPGRKVAMLLPSVDDVAQLLQKRTADNFKVEKPEEVTDVLKKYLHEKFLGQGAHQVGMIAAWGPKPLGDAGGEFAEVAALMLQSLEAVRACQEAKDYQFELNRSGLGRQCLVMPPSNFALLGLKDLFHQLLQGYRVLAVVQPRFYPHFKEIQRDLHECGLQEGLLDVIPGIAPEADPNVLHEILKQVDRLQFTGSSAMFRALVLKALELGNLRMEYAGEVSGLNKVRLAGVSSSHPAAAAGTAWAAMANNGELCTSASLVEFDPSTGDTAEAVKASLEGHAFKLGGNPEDAGLNVLLKDGKSTSLEVKTEAPELQEWWEKTILAVPHGSKPNTRTNESLGYCVYAKSINEALELAVKEDASCLYTVGVPTDVTAPSGRAGTNGCKLPESAFGGHKTHTFAVAGDHDGVGTLQTVLNNLKRRGASWRDGEEVHAKYELTDTAETMLDFLNAKEQQAFETQISNLLEVYAAFQPEVTYPYPGQPLVNASGSSQLVTLQALRPTRKHVYIPRGGGLPEDIVKLAAVSEMSPLREAPVHVHIMVDGKLPVADPLKSFVRVAEKQLKWQVHRHTSVDELVATVRSSEYPPYFYCVKERHMLPVELLQAVATRGGYLYEGFAADALSLFRTMTATQAWTVACTEEQVQEAQEALKRAWQGALRSEPHPSPELEPPNERQRDIGGGFNDTGFDDNDWSELSSDSSDDEGDTKAQVKEAMKDAK